MANNNNQVKTIDMTEEKQEIKHEVVNEIKIYILSQKCLKDLQVIINGSQRDRAEKYTTIKLIVEGQTVELPQQYCMTDIEINRIKNTFGIYKVEVMQ